MPLNTISTGRALLAGGDRPLDFALADCVFTPGMAIRAGSVFAGAPICQGKWDGSGISDVLSLSRGAQVASNFYAQFDPYQGGGFVIWTPEQSSGAQAGYARIFVSDSGIYYGLWYEYANTRYALKAGDKTMYVSATVTAGTKEILAWGFDCKKTLDGTNYAYLSRNDVQTFGITTLPTVGAPAATMPIGSFGGGQSVNGIIEGLTFVREVPWTGVYGTDLGLGDVVAAHYAAGVGADVCNTIGSWGVTFCLPTNATPGALTSGVGNAWSHPHDTPVLADTFCQTTYATSAWGTKGTPSAGPADIAAAANKVYQWGYQWTADANAEGITQTIAGLTAGANYVLRLIAHCTSANDIRVLIYDATNTAAISTYLFGASSSVGAPGVALITFELPTEARNGAAADCVSIIVSVEATAAAQVVYVHQVELQAALDDNPSLDTGAAADPFVPHGWTSVDLDAGDTETDVATVHSGAASLQFNTTASGEGISQQITAPVGSFVKVGLWSYGDTAAGFTIGGLNATKLLLQYSTTLFNKATPHTAAWAKTTAVFRVIAANPSIYILADAGATGERFIDDVSVVVDTAVSLTATPAILANSIEASGIRVDGRDSCVQTIPAGRLKPSSGRVRWRWTPRHNAADFVKFSGGGTVYLLDIRGGANIIQAYCPSANDIRFYITIGGLGAQIGDWPCAGLIVANTTYAMEVRYSSSGVRFYVDGILRINVPYNLGFGATVPTAICWGHHPSVYQNSDATFRAP